MTKNKPDTFLPETKGVEESPSYIVRIISARIKLWLLLGSAIFLICLLYGFFLFPQSYTSTVSISIQSNSSPSGALALLGGSNGPKKYIGVIKSRRLIAEIDKVVNLRELLDFPDTVRGQEEALDKVVKELKIEDNANDGLLYITVNLSGPAKLVSDPRGRRRRLPYAAALTANLYADALRRYMKNTDTDKELSLLRSAEAQVNNAKAHYSNEMEALGKYIREHRLSTTYASSSLGFSSSGSGGATGSAGGSGTSSEMTPSLSELQSSYLRRNVLKQQIASLKSVIDKTQILLNSPTDQIASLPTEDPVLTSSRKQFNEALITLKSLQITYGDSKPEVLRAKEQLSILQRKLHEQVQAILQGKTSEHLKLAALEAEYEVVLQQISISERDLYLSKNSAFDYSKLSYNATIALEVYKTKLTSLSTLQVQTVSAQNRMAIVDAATLPRDSKPGYMMITAVCLLISGMLLALWLVIELQIAQLKLKAD